MIGLGLIKRVYQKEALGYPIDRELKIAAKGFMATSEVARTRYVDHNGDLQWCHGADAVSREMVKRIRTAIEEIELTGTISMLSLDKLVTMVHHNGLMADKFISVPGVSGEDAARIILAALDKLSK